MAPTEQQQPSDARLLLAGLPWWPDPGCIQIRLRTPT
eukprot:CAMPEP_0113688696 /NCGR_PEP_ID=MMETSP0038_2-20120614/16686_1 /TAXON_ID=2898 /ORGANISM="Cryptomonas paramecium" /LENGTH=36 /DNA_ID=CAMNT_0000609553 /DNA_START=317 /DNA_END=423 /DNA_ORIENTATION=+ /assembly_acc=CAM_ASM_000170